MQIQSIDITRIIVAIIINEEVNLMSMNRTFVKVLMVASPNRAYLASYLQYFAKIPLRGTSDTLGTLYAIFTWQHGCNEVTTESANYGLLRGV